MFNQIVFNEAFRRTVGHEGGFVDDPDDPGGRTKYGISQRSYPDADIENLSLTDAKEIYRKDYWTPLRCDDISSDEVAIELFDTGVNMGNTQAVKIAQRAVNFISRDSIVVDGKIGRNTLARINEWCLRDAELLFKVMNGFQFIRYVEIVAGRETSRKYARGWMKRIQQYRG